MEKEMHDTKPQQKALIYRVDELEQYRIDQNEVIEKIFARLKHAEDRIDQILGSEPRESDHEIMRPARERLGR